MDSKLLLFLIGLLGSLVVEDYLTVACYYEQNACKVHDRFVPYMDSVVLYLSKLNHECSSHCYCVCVDMCDAREFSH